LIENTLGSERFNISKDIGYVTDLDNGALNELKQTD